MRYCDFSCFYFFFFNDTATTEIYTLSLHDALPICYRHTCICCGTGASAYRCESLARDRKSTRLNSSHWRISYAVFCLKKKKITKPNKKSTDTTSSPQYSDTPMITY